MYICTKQTLQTLVLLFFMLFSITAHADKHIQRFSSLQFGTEEGLNSLRVFSIATDKSGAIWMGTLDGINRFNGRSMKSYKLGTNQRFSDASGSTTMLTISPNNSLYAYNNVGRIYRYNLLTDQFELYLDLAEHIYMGLVLHYLFIDSQEQLWIGLNSGLYCCLLGETPQLIAVSYTHLTLPTIINRYFQLWSEKYQSQFMARAACQKRFSPSHSYPFHDRNDTVHRFIGF